MNALPFSSQTKEKRLKLWWRQRPRHPKDPRPPPEAVWIMDVSCDKRTAKKVELPRNEWLKCCLLSFWSFSSAGLHFTLPRPGLYSTTTAWSATSHQWLCRLYICCHTCRRAVIQSLTVSWTGSFDRDSSLLLSVVFVWVGPSLLGASCTRPQVTRCQQEQVKTNPGQLKFTALLPNRTFVPKMAATALVDYTRRTVTIIRTKFSHPSDKCWWEIRLRSDIGLIAVWLCAVTILLNHW